MVTFALRPHKDNTGSQHCKGTLVVPQTHQGQNQSLISVGTESLGLEEGGPSSAVSGGVLWLLWVLAQIFC